MSWADSEPPASSRLLFPIFARPVKNPPAKKLFRATSCAERLLLAPARRSHLDMVDADDRHRRRSTIAAVSARLEDTLVSGYTRLAAEAPRRRIDIELRVLDVLFATIFGLVLAGIVGMFQPWVFDFFGWGFLLLLFGTIGFTIISNITPRRQDNPETTVRTGTS